MDDKEYLEKLGENIVKIRKAKNLKQIDLAYLIEIEDSLLRRIEKGRINTSVIMLRRIAAALKIPVSKLFEFEE